MSRIVRIDLVNFLAMGQKERERARSAPFGAKPPGSAMLDDNLLIGPRGGPVRNKAKA